MSTREQAIEAALAFFDSGAFRDRLAELVAIPSTLQDPDHEQDVWRYLEQAIRPWVERLGFTAAIHPNPKPGFGPILVAERIENPAFRTVLTYGYGNAISSVIFCCRLRARGTVPRRRSAAFSSTGHPPRGIAEGGFVRQRAGEFPSDIYFHGRAMAAAVIRRGHPGRDHPQDSAHVLRSGSLRG